MTNPQNHLKVALVQADTRFDEVSGNLAMLEEMLEAVEEKADIYLLPELFNTGYQNAFSTITFLDLSTSVVKSVIFGFTIGIVGSYKGFNASQGTRGVGKAANQAVVMAMFLIFMEEMLIVQVSNWLRYF